MMSLFCLIFEGIFEHEILDYFVPYCLTMGLLLL